MTAVHVFLWGVKIGLVLEIQDVKGQNVSRSFKIVTCGRCDRNRGRGIDMQQRSPIRFEPDSL